MESGEEEGFDVGEDEEMDYDVEVGDFDDVGSSGMEGNILCYGICVLGRVY